MDAPSRTTAPRAPWTSPRATSRRGATTSPKPASPLLLRSVPDFAEAWHKRAVLYYLLGRDDECLHDLRRTLELEPRHFGAMLHFVEILRAARADVRGALRAGRGALDPSPSVNS